MAPELRRRLTALERRASPRRVGPIIDAALLTDDELAFLEALPWKSGGIEVDEAALTEAQRDRVEAIISRFTGGANDKRGEC